MKNMRYQFFGNLIRGKISVSKLMEQGNELGIDLMAPAYNFMLFKIFSKNENDTEAVYDLRTKEDAIVEEVSSQFENMIVFHRVTEGYILMIKAQNTEETIQVAKDYVAALTKRMKKRKNYNGLQGLDMQWNDYITFRNLTTVQARLLHTSISLLGMKRCF